MKTNTKNFFRQLWVWVFLLIPLFKTVAQQPTYIQGMKYTDVAFSVYFAHCDNRQVSYTLNGNPFPVTMVYASGGFIANRFPYGILKVGDVFKVTNTCDGTSVSTVVQDDFSYLEVPNGVSYTGNGISATDSDPPYNRLQTPVQVGQCEVMKNINAHILDSYFFSMNTAITFGKFKHNGIPIVQSDYNDDHYGQSVTWHINPDGSVYTNNATKLTSIQLYSGASPQTISYTHNGAVFDNDLTISFGGLAIRYIQNGSYSIEKSTAAGFQRTDYQGAFNNSTFEIRYNSSTIEAWVNGVKIDQLTKDVQYTVSGGGTISNTAALPYGTPVDFTPTTAGDYIFTALVNGIRKVEQKFHIASKPTLSNTVTNANCSALGSITANGNGGFGALQYNINGGTFSANNTFGNLSPGNYTLSVKDASGCVFTNNASVTITGQNPSLTLTNTACAADLKTYSISFSSDGTVSATSGTVSGNMVTGIPAGTNVTLRATSSANCQTTLNVNAPICACPTVNAPISGGDQTTTCVGAAIPAISVTVNAGETADWYDAPTGGNFVETASTSYQPTQQGTFYAVARNTTTGCISASRTSVTVSQNALPSLSFVSATCAADLKTYQVNFTSDGVISTTAGTVSGSMVTGIPAGMNVTLTATSSAGCQTTLAVNAPNCACPNVNAPISGGNQTTTCVGAAIPAISVTVNAGETADWYDAPTGGNLLASATTSYQANSGTYYAEARNTTTGCISASRTSVTVSQNTLPSLSLASTACSADLKTYSIAFASDGTVTTTAGTVSGSTVTGIPAGTNVTLTATSSANCQTTLNVNAPNCTCPNVNAPISGGDQTATCVGAAIPAISVTVNAGETADWYDAPTGGNLLASATTSYQANSGTYYAQARNTTTNCVSASRTGVTVSQNVLPSLTLTSTACSADLKTYSIAFASDGTVTTTAGTVSGSTVTGIPAGTNVTLTATSSANCQNTLNINAPNCACPNVNAPISGGDQTTTCVGTAIPAILVTVNAGETADWYDAPTGGNLLATASTTYQATQSGTYYAQARNTTTNCVSANRTAVTVSQNALPSLSITSVACSADLKSYSINFNSNATVTSSVGTVSAGTVSGIPTGTSIVLTATSSAGCQTTLNVNAPNCACPNVNAPISGGNQTTTCVGTAIPAISVTVNTGETADWYDAPTGGNLLASNTTTYQATQGQYPLGGTYYAQARNTTTNCVSASRTGVTVSQNALPSITLVSATCAADLKTYQVSFTSDGLVSASTGTLSGNTVTGISTGTNIALTATSSAGCQTTLNVNAPNCACPNVNAPISGGDQTTTCVGDAIPAISVTVNTGETADWYDAPTGGDFVATASTTYQVTQSGTYYAQARNTTTGCISASRTAVTVSQNALPSLSITGASCSFDLKTYSIAFASDGTVTATAGTISGNMVSGIPAGTNIVLTATSSAGCQTTLNVNAPNCACPNVNAPISGGNQTSTCVGTAIPAISVTVNAGETADWYDAPTGGNLLASNTTSYQASQSGIYYAQARNTTTGCISASRTGITITVNGLPTLSATEPICTLDNRTYSFSFSSNGKVSSNVGTITGNTITGVPTGTNVTLTATATTGCQTILNVNAPKCSPCALKVWADATSISQGQTTTLHASGCNGGYFVWENTGKEGTDISVQPLKTTTYKGTCSFIPGVVQCAAEITISVSPCQLSATASSENINQGESVTLSASGCPNGYLIWAGTNSESSTITVTPLVTTTYTAQCWYSTGVVSCGISKTINVTPCQLSATASSENITQGESVTLSASGCKNGYLIWSGTNSESSTITVTPYVTTTYTAKCWYANGNGKESCSITKTITVTPCQLSATASSENINQGESVTLSASGCKNGYLIWSGTNSESSTITVTPYVTTTYTAKCWYATGNGTGNESCSISKTITVTPCQLSATVSRDNITKGESVTLSASGCKNGYLLWEGSNSESPTITVTPLVTTTYTAKCWYANGNESCSISKTITVEPCHLSATTEKASLTLGESLLITSTGCMGTLLYPQDTTQNGKSVFDFVPTKTQDFTIQCQVGNVISCDTTIHINVEPCHLSATTEKASLTLGESLSIASTGCIGTLIYPQDTTQNGKSVFAFVPTKTQDFTIQCKIGNIISCDTTIHITVEPCHLSAMAEKASVMGGELLKITSTGCMGTLLYPQDTTQNGKSVFSYLPNKTQTYTVQCKIGNIISCDTTMSIIVDKCPAVIQATATTIIKGDYTTLSYEGCPNTVVWKDLGTGTNKKVNPTKATTYYASCNYGDKLQYSCSSDSIVIKVRPKQPILDNNRLGTSGIALQDTICLNTDLLMQMNCEQGATPYWNGKALNQLKVDASQVGIQTYQFYCQNDDDGEKSEESFANVVVKGFEIEDAIVYPNPTTGILRIKSTGCLDNLHLVLYTLYGQVLYQGNGENRTSDSINIDLTYLPSNEYVLHITGKQGANEIVTKRVRVIKYSK